MLKSPMRIGGLSLSANDTGTAIELLKQVGAPFDETESLKFSFGRSVLLPHAYEVGQGQVGYSASQMMATRNIADCIGLVLHDPASKRTSLAHIDRYTTSRSIENIFASMPPVPLDAILIGAKYGPDYEEGFAKQHSENNLVKVLNVLDGQDVNIVAAQIHDKLQTSNFCVDPESFTIQKNFEIISNPNHMLANAKWILMEDRLDIETCFDFTVSKDRLPVFLKPDLVDYIRAMSRKSEDQIANVFIEAGGDFSHAPIHAQWLVAARRAHYGASQRLMQEGYRMPEGTGLFVGTGALKANKELIANLAGYSQSAGLDPSPR